MLRPGSARSSSSGARTLEDVIKWGSSELFANIPDPPSQEAQPAAGEAGAEEGQQLQALEQQRPDDAAASGADVEMTDAAAPPPSAAAVAAKPQQISYSTEQVQRLLERGATTCVAAAIDGISEGESAAAAALGAGLEMASVRFWPDVGKRVEEDTGMKLP